MWWISGTIRSRPEHVLACETGRLRRQLRKVNLVAIDIPGREHVWRDGASVFGARYCKLRLWRSDEIFGKQLCSLQRLWSSGTFGKFSSAPRNPGRSCRVCSSCPALPNRLRRHTEIHFQVTRLDISSHREGLGAGCDNWKCDFLRDPSC